MRALPPYFYVGGRVRRRSEPRSSPGLRRAASSPGARSLAALALVMSLAAPAWADESLDTLLAHGLAQYKRGEYAASAATFSRAYAIDPRPRILFNIARAEEKAGATADAIAHYRAYLQSGQTEAALTLRARESVARLEASPPPAPATSPEPAPAPAPSPPPAPAAEAPPPAPVTPPPAQPAAVATHTPDRQAATASSAPPSVEPSRHSSFGYIGLVAGGAALAAGVGLGLWANATATQERRSTKADEKPSLRDAAYGRAVAADVTMVVGAVLVTGALMYLLWPRSGSTPRASATFPNSLELRL